MAGGLVALATLAGSGIVGLYLSMWRSLLLGA